MSDIVTNLDTSKASEASAKLHLRVLLIMDMRAQAFGMPPVGGTRLGFTLSQGPALWNIVEDSLIAMYQMEVQIENRSDAPVVPVANIVVSLRAEYKFAPAFQLERDEHLLEHYVGIVGRMHAWPYFRAEVQTLSAKLGLPPLTLPVVLSGDMAKLPVTRWTEHTTERPPPLPAVSKPSASKGSTKRAPAKRKAPSRAKVR